MDRIPAEQILVTYIDSSTSIEIDDWTSLAAFTIGGEVLYHHEEVYGEPDPITDEKQGYRYRRLLMGDRYSEPNDEEKTAIRLAAITWWEVPELNDPDDICDVMDSISQDAATLGVEFRDHLCEGGIVPTHFGLIESLWVHPAIRRSHLGRMLFYRVASRVTCVAGVAMPPHPEEVDLDNLRAFYTDLGAVDVASVGGGEGFLFLYDPRLSKKVESIRRAIAIKSKSSVSLSLPQTELLTAMRHALTNGTAQYRNAPIKRVGSRRVLVETSRYGQQGRVLTSLSTKGLVSSPCVPGTGVVVWSPMEIELTEKGMSIDL